MPIDFLSIPILVSTFFFPFIGKIRIFQLLIIFSALSNEYISAGAMAIGLMIIVFRSFKNMKEIKIKSNNGLISISILWIIYSSVTAFWVGNEGRFITEYMQLILILLLINVMCFSVNKESDLKKVMIGFVMCGVLCAIRSIWNSYLPNHVPLNYHAFIIIIGCVLIPVSFWKSTTFKNLVSLLAISALGFAGVYVNESRGSILLGVFCIIIRFVVLVPASKVTGVLRLLTLVGGVVYGILEYYRSSDDNILKSVTDTQVNFSNMERLALIQQSWDLFLKNPLGLGWGASSEIFLTSSYTVGSYPHPHNTLAHLIVELGVVGLFIFALLFYYSIRIIIYLRKNNDRGRLMSYYRLSYMMTFALFLFSFLDDMFFNGLFFFYCLSFFALIFIFKKIASQESFTVNKALYA